MVAERSVNQGKFMVT